MKNETPATFRMKWELLLVVTVVDTYNRLAAVLHLDPYGSRAGDEIK